jgi:acyl-CoA dehydrogenase
VRDIVGEIRELLAQGPLADETITRALAAFDIMATVAREPRKLRQIRLGNSVGSEKR